MNIASTKTYKYSEIFYSFQGEGKYTGRPTTWVRFFLCNLTCDGFGQKDPTDPSTYILPYEDFDVSTVKRIEDLPVWEYGCDSSYTWAKKYRHLAHDEPAVEICNKLRGVMEHPSNPDGLFIHPQTGQVTDLAFTGGEPMLNQAAMVDILQTFKQQGNFPSRVTVETNGTKPFKEKDGLFEYIVLNYSGGQREWYWSCSPKLFSTSGEKPKKAICPEVLAEYNRASSHGQLKFVVNGTQETWDELEDAVAKYRAAGVQWDVYVMAVGATVEEQSENVIADIAIEALKRGYYFSGRLHCYVFGNAIGT